MISPFFVGLIADRYFASEKLLAVFGLLGGVVLCLLPQMTTFATFYPVLILYCALFVPTLALGNSLSLHHLADPERDFPRVKVLSAVGWIAAGMVLSALAAEQRALQFYLAGASSIAFGLFSLTLPHTPPRKTGADVSLGEILGLDALALLKKPSFAIFIACMFLICIPLYFYFVKMSIYLTELGWEQIAAKMTLAQVSDVVFLFLLPVLLKTLGYKTTIVIGILAWVLRYFVLAGSVDAAGLQAPLIFAAICCTASATTSCSSPGSSTWTTRPTSGSAARRRGSSRSSCGARARSSGRCWPAACWRRTSWRRARPAGDLRLAGDLEPAGVGRGGGAGAVRAVLPQPGAGRSGAVGRGGRLERHHGVVVRLHRRVIDGRRREQHVAFGPVHLEVAWHDRRGLQAAAVRPGCRAQHRPPCRRPAPADRGRRD